MFIFKVRLGLLVILLPTPYYIYTLLYVYLQGWTSFVGYPPASPTTSIPCYMFICKVGLALLVILLPTPYYIRVAILYNFEHDEVMSRKDAAKRVGLHESFETSLVHYLLPDHPLFIAIYVVYGITAVILAYMARRSEARLFFHVTYI